MIAKSQRQQRIRELLARNEIHNQEQLQELLRTERIEITQATLSRDLRDIGAFRGANGYGLPDPALRGKLQSKVLRQALRTSSAITRSGTMVVLRTEPGHAPALAAEIGKTGLPQIVGVIAGHDSVFVATGSGGQARELQRLFRV